MNKKEVLEIRKQFTPDNCAITRMAPVLGRMCKGEKKIYASFILCQDIEYQTDDRFHS